MIVGTGTDIVEIERVRAILAKQGARFKQRIFTPAEQLYAEKSPHTANAYAKRFAAKEAMAKALGTGLRGLGAGDADSKGVSWTEIEVVNNQAGRPAIILHGGALAAAQSCCPASHKPNIHLSLSDEADMALAFVIIEADLSENHG